MQKIIAIVFDFDDTLAPDTTSGLIKSLGVCPEHFWGTEVATLIANGWDPATAYLYKLIELSNKSQKTRITKKKLVAWGKKVKPFAGVAQMFDRVRRHARQVDRSLEVEFYGISSGLGHVIRSTCIAKEFKRIWTSNFSYAPDGSIDFPKNIISFTDKTRFLYMTSKGLISEKDPFAVNRKVPYSKIRVPFENMVYVGDGYTDTFAGMKKDLDAEKRAMTKIWKKREAEIEIVTGNMLGMCGELQAIAQMPQLETIAALGGLPEHIEQAGELPDIEEGP